MKNLRKLSVLFLSLVLITACSNSENEVSNENLLTNKTWTYSSFKLLNYSNTDKTYEPIILENQVNNLNKDIALKFNEDGSGLLQSSSVNRNFTWTQIGNKLQLVLPNLDQNTDDLIEYIFTVSSSELALKLTSEIIIYIDDDEINVIGTFIFN